MGGLQVEIHCSNQQESLPEQTLTLSVHRLSPVLRRLEANGIPVSEISQDPYTALRRVRISGPDGVRIIILEK